MHPLSLDVGIYIVVAYFIVSFLLFILARCIFPLDLFLFNNIPLDRFSPYEWDNPHPCNEQEVNLGETRGTRAR